MNPGIDYCSTFPGMNEPCHRPDTVAAPRQPKTIGELLDNWRDEAEAKREYEQERSKAIKSARPMKTVGDLLDNY